MALFQPPMELCTDSPGTKKYSVLKFRERKCQQGGTSPLSKIHVSEHSLHGVLFLQILVQFLNREVHRSYLSQYRIASKWREGFQWRYRGFAIGAPVMPLEEKQFGKLKA